MEAGERGGGRDDDPPPRRPGERTVEDDEKHARREQKAGPFETDGNAGERKADDDDVPVAEPNLARFPGRPDMEPRDPERRPGGEKDGEGEREHSGPRQIVGAHRHPGRGDPRPDRDREQDGADHRLPGAILERDHAGRLAAAAFNSSLYGPRLAEKRVFPAGAA